MGYAQHEGDELCGVLTGSQIDERTFRVSKVSPPCVARNSRCGCERDAVKANTFIKKDYEASEHTRVYIGEWHTHPEMKPNYSQIDFDNWIKINDEDIYYDNQYQIIAGIEEIRIWKVEKDHKIYNVYNYCWKEFMEEMI